MDKKQLIVNGLGDASREVFESTLVEGSGYFNNIEAEQRRTFLKSAIAAISSVPTLTMRERDRRLRLLLSSPGFSQSDLVALAESLDIKALGLVNVFLSVLVPENKTALRQGRAGTYCERVDLEPSLPESESFSGAVVSLLEDSSNARVFRAVVLLGTEAEHLANVSILKDSQFSPLLLRRELANSLEKLLSAEVCGLVVGGSFWEGKSEGEQVDDLAKICGLSSLIFLKIDEANLLPAAASLLADLHDQRGSGMCRAMGCELTSSDRVIMERVVSLLGSSEVVPLVLEELSEHESRLLRLVATDLVRGKRGSSNRSIGRLGVTFINGGRSGAKVLLLKPDDGGAPVVAKVHTIESLREEVDRYEKYIRRWEPSVRPMLYFHLRSSLLVYNLVDDFRNPNSPAPTLEDCLDKLLNSELGFANQAPGEDDIVVAVESAIQKIGRLNSIVPGEKNGYPVNWLAWGVKELRNKGVLWVFESEGKSSDLGSGIDNWIRQVGKLEGVATVHGDIHLRNILISGDRIPMFIDFSYSGPGHPGYDLARLTVAIVCRAFRMLHEEIFVAGMFRSILLDGASFEDLSEKYSQLLACSANRVAIRSLVRGRSTCLNVIRKYGGTLQDFMAIQGLVLCQTLTMNSLQSCAARAMLRAIIG